MSIRVCRAMNKVEMKMEERSKSSVFMLSWRMRCEGGRGDWKKTRREEKKERKKRKKVTSCSLGFFFFVGRTIRDTRHHHCLSCIHCLWTRTDRHLEGFVSTTKKKKNSENFLHNKQQVFSLFFFDGYLLTRPSLDTSLDTHSTQEEGETRLVLPLCTRPHVCVSVLSELTN